MKRVALITGATSGIGDATARAFAERGYDLIVTGRRADRLKGLKQELKEKNNINVHILSFDIRDRRSCEAALSSLPEKYREIDVLVNNAGRASDFVKFHMGDLVNWDEVIDTNVKGMLYITRIVSQDMVNRGHGHIVNIGSIAGTQPYENGNVYSASKHAVHAISQSIRIDLIGTGVKVTEIRPGKVETEFSLVRYKGDADQARKVYEGFKPLESKDVAAAIIWAVDQPAHVNVDEIVITPAERHNSCPGK